MLQKNDKKTIKNQLQNQYKVNLPLNKIEELSNLIHNGKIQQALNLLSTEPLEISQIKNVLDLIKNAIQANENSEQNIEKTLINPTDKSLNIITDGSITKPLIKDAEKRPNFIELFNFNRIRSIIFKSKTKETEHFSSEFNKHSDTKNIDNLVTRVINSFIEKERKNCKLIKSSNNFFELQFFDKKIILLFKEIKSAHLKNKDISRIQLSGNHKIPTEYSLVPIGVDLINEIFVFWNPNGFIERFEHNKNTSFYSSFEKQHKATISGIIEHKLSNEIIYISNFHNFHNQLISRINSINEIKIKEIKPESSNYSINSKYCDKLNNKSNLDQISNWLSTDDEKLNNKNPFNNYRGIRTLEFQKRNDIPAFFIFVTTLSKRKDDTANIWSDRYDEDSGHLSYHGDAKPGRELYNTQNHGNCRLRKITRITQTQGLIPPVIYFVKTRKGEMEFKGIFKIINIEEFNDVANGTIFRNLKIELQRDIEITNIKPFDIVSIRVLGINNLFAAEWYIRNCAKL